MRSLGSAGLVGIAITAALAGPTFDQKGQHKSPMTPAEAKVRLDKQSKRFIENAGQWNSQARFMARSGNMNVWITRLGVTYDFHGSQLPGSKSPMAGQVVSMKFLGASAQPSVSGLSQMKSKTDFVDLNGTSTVSAHSYEAVVSKGIYPGIDLKSYFDNGKPRYDFVVAPGANPANIRIAFKGADHVITSKDRIELGTHVGRVFQGKLYAYQVVKGVKKQVEASFESAGREEVALHIGKFDKSRELVIDPLVYGSYYGGDDGFDEVTNVTSDANGGTYLTGWTRATQFPLIQGPYGFNLAGGGTNRQAFITKLQGDAYFQDYSALIQGAGGNNVGQFVQVDPFGNVWIAGKAASTAFPRPLVWALSQTTPQAAGGTFTVSYTDGTGTYTTPALAYNASAATVQTQLNALTPLASKVNVVSTGSTVDAGGTYNINLTDDLSAGNITVNSSALVNSTGATGPAYGATKSNTTKTGVFVIRFARTADGSIDPKPSTKTLLFGTNATTLAGFGIVPSSNPLPGSPIQFVFGGTTSASLSPDVPGTFPGGRTGYIARYSFDGVSFTRVDAATQYIQGGSGIEVGGVTVDKEGSAYVAGTISFTGNAQLSSTSTVFKTTPGIFAQGDLLRNNDIFVRKYATDGTLVYSGVIGGNSNDKCGGIINDLAGNPVNTGSAIAVDGNLNAYVTGVSSSFDFPRTRGVYGETFGAGRVVTITKLNSDASQIVYSTNLKTNARVDSAGIAVDLRGYAFVTCLLSPVNNVDFPDPNSTPGDPNEPTAYPSASGPGLPSVPVTADALDPTYTFPAAPELPTSEGALLVINDTATSLIYGTYIGGQLDEFIYGPYVDQFGDVWVFGSTESARSYQRVSSTGTVTTRSQSATLPDTLISPLAFKSRGDASGSMAQTTLYGSTSIAVPNYTPSPASISIMYQQDGFIIKQRVGQPAVQSVTVDPGTIPGGAVGSGPTQSTVTGTVTLTSAAPASGADITLTLDSTSAASFDAAQAVITTTITIPAGGTTGTFKVYSTPVAANTNVQVRATYQGSFKIAQFVVVPWLQQLSLTPGSVVGGQTATGKITLAAAAPVGGVAVDLSSDTPSLISFPNGNQVTVPQGQTTVTFPILTQGVDSASFPNVTASLLGLGKTQTLQVTPPSLVSIAFAPPSVAGGTTSVGMLQLDGAVGPTPINVTLSLNAGTAGYTLSSGSTSGTTISVQIPSGASSLTFNVNTAYESVNTQRKVTANRPAQGSLPAQSVSGTLFVTAVNLTGLTVSPSSVNAGGTAVGSVTISSPAPAGGVVVNLSASNGLASVPATVVVPVGTTSANFDITAAVTSTSGNVTITASRGSVTKTATLAVQGVTFSLKLNPSSVVGGASGSTGTITLSQPAGAAGVTVSLTSSSPTTASVPATVTVAAGASTATFTVSTSAVTAVKSVTITGTAGTASASDILTVRPVGIASVSFNPSKVRGGLSSTFTVNLEAPAPAGGAKVTLSSSFGSAFSTLPSSVVIPAGATSASVTVTTQRVSRDIASTVTASYNGTSANATLVITR